MASKPAVVSHHQPDSASQKKYISGFGLSIVLTLLAYSCVTHHWFRGAALVGFIIALALVQFVAQLIFFLHLSSETRPRWRLLVLFFMVGVVLILVVGSIWIMYNLNYRMSPQQINNYLKSQDGGV